ncbi:MAG TPA: EAL domain-containing protein [Steroidobacteraceae bacterium]|nr:EAL domain-containing protein [Steroidobacteraceae bacterium]
MENGSTPGDRLNNFTGEEQAPRRWLVPLIVAVGVAGTAAACAYSWENSHRFELAPAGVLAIGSILTLLAGALAWALTSNRRRGAEIRSQQALLANFVAEASDAIVMESLDGIVLSWNAAATKLFGYCAEDAVGRRLIDLILTSDSVYEDSDRLDRCAGGLRVAPFDTIRRRQDGTHVEVSITANPVIGPTGRVVAVAKTIRDISARKAAESEIFLEQAGAISAVGGFRIDLQSGRQVWTRQTFKIYEVEGDVAPSAEEFDRLMAPDVGARLWQAIRDASETGTGYDIEIPAQTARGRPIWIRTIGVVEFDEGKPVRVVGATQDITERKRADEALVESESKFRSLFELSPVGIALNDRESGQFLHVNNALAHSTGYTREELLAMTQRDVTPIGSADTAVAQLAMLDQSAQFGPYETEYRRKDGSRFAVLICGIGTKDAADRTLIWSFVQDISQRKAMESQLADAARRDKLTGLANRALFMDRLEKAVTRVQRGEQALFATMFLDFDRFKLINDTLGHDAGDELLRQIAQRLRRELRASDALTLDESSNVVSRFGGDEFLLLINDLKAPSDAARIAERLLNALAPAYDIQGNEVFSSASIGIVTSEQCRTNADDVVRNADVAMYEAKRAGRGCSVVFNEAMQTRLSRHVTVESNLRRAIANGELYLVYQPIVDLSTRQMVSAEALLRWNHPTLGEISPVEFIPIAEESGLIVALGQWVQKQACRAMVNWRAQDLARAPATVSVNVSRAELALGRRLLEQVRGTLEHLGLPADCLQLEVTEREIMRNPEAAHALMLELQSLGVKLAMDDFGTGTSSLGFLRNYPFNTIKIDRSFVQDVTGSADVLAVIHATISLVENLGMASLAEGVENPAQIAVLQSLGCRYAQGYYFSRPVRAEYLLDAMKSADSARPAATEV